MLPPNPTLEADDAVTMIQEGELSETPNLPEASKPEKETAVTRYKAALAEREKLKQPAYVRTLMWGIEDDTFGITRPAKTRKKDHFEEWHEGRRLQHGGASGYRDGTPVGALVYYARRPSHEDLGKDGNEPKNYLKQKKNFNFCMLLVGTMLHYLVLFFYFGVLGSYQTFDEEYISVAPPEGQPDWAPSTQSFIKRKEVARKYVRAYFDEQWKATIGVVLGFQLAMFIWHVFFNHHRKGRWARGFRALTMVDGIWEFLVCLKSRDMTAEYRTLRRFEMVFRGLPVAVMMSSVVIRFHHVFTNADEESYICKIQETFSDGSVQTVDSLCFRDVYICDKANACTTKSALIFAIMLTIISAVITTVDNMGSLKPSFFMSIALKGYGLCARILLIGFCLTSAMMRVSVFATYSVALETKVFETLAWIIVGRGAAFAVLDLADLWGDECTQKLFTKPKRGDKDLVSKIERDKQSFVRFKGVELFCQSWAFGCFWTIQTLFIDAPIMDMKSGRHLNGFLPVIAQLFMSTIEIYAAFDAGCVASMHPLPTHFGCVCTESKSDRSAELSCLTEHAKSETRGGDPSLFLKGIEMWGGRPDVSLLYGFHVTCLFVLGWMSWRKLKRKPVTYDDVDAEENATQSHLDNATIAPSERKVVPVEEGPGEVESEEGSDYDESGSGSDSDNESGSDASSPKQIENG
jgi:hypothetical protein